MRRTTVKFRRIFQSAVRLRNKNSVFYSFQLEEKGPYVYSTKSKNVNVKFENGKVTSTPFEQAKFNKTLTEKECPTCTAHDKVCCHFHFQLSISMCRRYLAWRDVDDLMITISIIIFLNSYTWHKIGRICPD